MINLDTRLFDEINSDELWFLCHIVKRFNERLICWPSNKTLCSDTKWSLKKMQGIKSGLIKKGFLISKIRYSKDSQSSNEYMINTEFLGVFVSGKKIPLGLEDDGGASILHTPHESKGNTPHESKGGNKVLTSEVLTNEVNSSESKDSEYQKALFIIPSIEKKESKRTKEQTKTEIQLAHSVCKNFWLDEYPTMKMSWNGEQAKSLNDVIILMQSDCHERQLKGTCDEIVDMFKWFVNNLPDFYKGQDLALIRRKIGNITYLIKNGKPTGQKKQSARDYINSFKQGG